MGDETIPAPVSPRPVGPPAPSGARTRDLRQVLRNAASLLGAYVAPRVFTFAAAVVAARVLGVAEFGAYASAAAIAVIFSLAATLGVMQLLVREVARAPGRAPELVGAAHAAKAVSVTTMLAVLWLVAAGPLGLPPRVVGATLLLGAAYGVGAFAENLGGYFQGVERMGVWLQAQALYGVVFGAIGILLVLVTRDLLWFCSAPLIGQAAGLVWLMARAPAPVRRARSASPRRVVALVRGILPFAAAFGLLTAYYKVDILLLERWRGLEAAGVYGAAYRFVDIAQALSVVVASALYPRLSRRLAGRAGGRAVELTILGAVPAAGLLWLLHDAVIAALFGASYAAAAPVLALLAPALPLLAVNTLGVFMLAAIDRTPLVAGMYAGALVLNVGLNAAWIPGAGAGGAAAAMLVSEAALAAGTLVALATLGPAPRLRVTAPAALVAIIGLAVAALPVPSVAAAALYGIVVVVAYGVLQVVPADERALLARAVRP